MFDDTDATAAELLMSTLREQRAAARNELLDALKSPRYLELLDTIVEAARAPQFAYSAHDEAKPKKREAKEFASNVFPRLVHKTWKQLKSAAEDLGPDSPDEDFHEVRILAKQCRYATEAALPFCGRPARDFASAIKGLQGVLGDLQDTVVSEAWLRDTTRAVPTIGIIGGLIVAAEREQRLTLRKSFDKEWKKASHESLRPWLK